MIKKTDTEKQLRRVVEEAVGNTSLLSSSPQTAEENRRPSLEEQIRSGVLREEDSDDSDKQARKVLSSHGESAEEERQTEKQARLTAEEEQAEGTPVSSTPASSFLQTGRLGKVLLAVRLFWEERMIAPLKKPASRLWQKVRELLAPAISKIKHTYKEIVPDMKRAAAGEGEKQKKLLLSLIIAVSAVAVISLTVLAVNLFTPGLSGRWTLPSLSESQSVVMEFSGSRVEAYINTDKGLLLYAEGEYRTYSEDEKNVLEISYDNGVKKKLYYEIRDDSGVFVDSGTGREQTWERR
jgi:hypothetical protein